MEYTDLLKKDRWLYLEKNEDAGNNELRILVSQSTHPKERSSKKESSNELEAIITDESLPLIEIVFDYYVGFNVINEGYAGVDKNEKYAGKFFRIYENSAFLDYIRKTTFAESVLEKQITHYEVACLNHIIQIADIGEPTIKLIEHKN